MGKVRLELTPCVLHARLSLMRCLLLIGASSWSGSTLLWPFIFFVLSRSKPQQSPWAINNNPSTAPGKTALYQEPAVYFIHVKVLYQGSDSKEENKTSAFRVWPAIKRFLLSWTFGLNPWTCLSRAIFLHFKHGLHLGHTVFPKFVVTLDDHKLVEHRIKYIHIQLC